jgi:2-phosphosulfolactate phosphatase
MRADVILTPGEVTSAELADRVVVVIDTLRATSSIVEALSAGAKLIYPVSSVDEALRLANTFGRGEVLLCGERKCLPIEGFDLGNSPREFTRERVEGKTLVMSTTNGTAAMALTTAASRVYIGAMLNLGAIVTELGRLEAEPVFLCSGRERNFALEDAVCAGLMVERLVGAGKHDWQLNDGARGAVALAKSFGSGPELFEMTAAGQAIKEAGFAEDLEFCAQLDVHDVLPVLQDRMITRATG